MLYEPSIFNDKISLLSQFEALKQYVIGFSPEGGVAVADYEFTLTHVIPDTIPKIAGNLITTYVNGNKATAPFEFPFAIKGSETIVVDVDENTEALEIHLDSDIVSKLQRAVVIPVSRPSSISLFAVDTTGAQTMITLGEGLTIEDGVLKVTGAVEPEEPETKTTTVTFKWNDGSTIGTYTSEEEEVYIFGDAHYGDGLGVYFGPKVTGDPDWGDSYPDSPPYNDYQFSSAAYNFTGFSTEQNGEIIAGYGEWYKLDAGETYTFYVRHDSEAAPTIATFYQLPYGGTQYIELGTYTTSSSSPYVSVSYDSDNGTNSIVTFAENTIIDGTAVDNIEIYDSTGARAEGNLEAGGTYTFYLVFEYDEFISPIGAEPTIVTFYKMPYGGGAYQNLGTYRTTIASPYIRIHGDDGNVGAASAVDFSGQEVFEGSAVDNLFLYEGDGEKLTFFTQYNGNIYPLVAGDSYTFYLVFDSDAFVDPNATITTINIYAPPIDQASGSTVYKWTTTATENLQLYIDSREILFSDDKGGTFGSYINGKIELLGLSKSSGGSIYLAPDHGVTITPGSTNTFYLSYEERALPITTLKLWTTDGDTTENERTLHTYITVSEAPYLYADDAEGAGAGVRFGEYGTTDWVYTSAWYSIEGFSAYESGTPLWQPALKWIPLLPGATYELYTIGDQ